MVVWSNLEGGIFDLYEIVPGFVFASLAVIGISLMKPQQGQIALQQFDEAASLLEETQQ